MMIVVTSLHVVACFILVLSVLLQAGKGADMGAVFGGASTTIFGGSGAGNFLTRITTAAAVVFMLTSLTLTYGPRRAGTASVMPESAPVPGAESVIPEAPVADVPGADAPIGDVPVAAAPAAEIPAAEAEAPAAPPPDTEAAPAGEDTSTAP